MKIREREGHEDHQRYILSNVLLLDKLHIPTVLQYSKIAPLTEAQTFTVWQIFHIQTGIGSVSLETLRGHIGHASESSYPD